MPLFSSASDAIDVPNDARISSLEAIARKLDPDAQERHELLRCAHQCVTSMLSGLPERGAFREFDVEASSSPDLTLFSIHEHADSMDNTVSILNKSVFDHGLSCSSGGDLSYVPGGGLFPAALGDLIADVANTYPSQYCSPGALHLERALIRWLADLIGFPSSAGGDLTSGGSIATLCAVVSARESHKIRCRDVETTVVYLSTQTHFCVRKALHIAGLGNCIVRFVDVDSQFRMKPESLSSLIVSDLKEGLKPWLIVASAGTTCVGSVDRLNPIADVASDHGLWLHVDAAYGGCFLLTDYGKELMQGIERADTVVIDPHKGLFLPLGSGAILARDVQALARAHRFTASYMQDDINAIGDDLLSPCDLGPELSRPFRGLRMWIPLRVFGTLPFRAALQEKLELARYLHHRLQQLPYFEVGPSPQLSIVHYRFVPVASVDTSDHANRVLVDAIRRDGTVFISSTRVNGRFMLRTAVLHFRTHREQIDHLLEVLQRESALLHEVELEEAELQAAA